MCGRSVPAADFDDERVHNRWAKWHYIFQKHLVFNGMVHMQRKWYWWFNFIGFLFCLDCHLLMQYN